MIESKVCSRSHGQPPGPRSRAMIETARSKRSPVVGMRPKHCKRRRCEWAMNGQPGSGAACAKQAHPGHSEASLSARNLLATSSEAADSSRDNPALRNDNSLGIFQITPLRKTSKPFLQRRKAEDKTIQKQQTYNYILCNCLRSFLDLYLDVPRS